MKCDGDKIGVTSAEEGKVARETGCERLVQVDAEAPLSTELENDKGTNVHKANPCGILPRLVHEVADGGDDVVDVDDDDDDGDDGDDDGDDSDDDDKII